VVWIGRCVVIIGMTTCAGIGCIIVITVVAGSTVVRDSRVRPDQLIEVIVNGESGWRPSRVRGVTGFTGGGQIEGQVARVGAGGIVIGVATSTGIGRIIIITVVASRTVVCHGSMCPCQRIVIVMYSESCRKPTLDQWYGRFRRL
jgi:hypothetical protein